MLRWFKRLETPEEAFERARREQIERVRAALLIMQDGLASITNTTTPKEPG